MLMMTTLTSACADPMLRTIRAAFEDMPRMHLTRQQFRRLWNLDRRECERMVDDLIAEGFLDEDFSGRLYMTGGNHV